MTTINLNTQIKAPIETVFDLSRNIDVHLQTMGHTQEKAIAGVTTGLINMNETVTWEGEHFGLRIQHQSIITAMEPPTYFVDEMKKGYFKWLKHEHIFKHENGTTVMIDKFCYQTPYGIFGKFFDSILLKKYLTALLEKRSVQIKQLAEIEFRN